MFKKIHFIANVADKVFPFQFNNNQTQLKIELYFQHLLEEGKRKRKITNKI